MTWLETISSIDAMIEQARIAEREACAEECETLAFDKAIAAWNKRADQSTELAALRAFAQAVMDCWPDGWGIEGDDLQRIATEHGMLRPEVRRDPCDSSCRCADMVLPQEWDDGVVCYRKTALLTGAEHGVEKSCDDAEAQVVAWLDTINSVDAPSVEDARKIVAVGGPTDDAERLAFEAWIVERCWDMQCVRWDGSGYRSPAAIIERRMWAAWRDRAALSKQQSVRIRADIAKKLK